MNLGFEIRTFFGIGFRNEWFTFDLETQEAKLKS